MTPVRSQIEAVFTGRAPAPAGLSSEDWRIATVERDVARCHALSCGRFDCALRGDIGEEGRPAGVHVVFIKAGTLEVRQWGRVATLSPGDIFVSCSWLPLSLRAPDRLEALIFDLPAKWAIERFIDRTVITPDLRISRAYFASGAIHGLAQAVFESASGEDGGARGIEMLGGLLRTALKAHAAEAAPLPKVRGRMGRILRFMMRHIEQTGLSAQDAAKELKCSPRTIYKTCADEGASFSRVLLDLRLVAAQHRLLRTDEQIAQVAYSVGFASLSHFCRLFKARFGASPTYYRRRSGLLDIAAGSVATAA